jgi:hypothetical protein
MILILLTQLYLKHLKFKNKIFIKYNKIFIKYNYIYIL